MKNFNDYYLPEATTVVQGDTVTFENPRSMPLTHQHDLNFDNNAYPGRGFANAWVYEVTFNEVGQYGFFCSRHGEHGTINVLPGNPGGGPTTIDMNPGLNGNWWNGPARNGEGVQLEIADGGNGELVLVATVYAYSPAGEQIFMIAVGNPEGGIADVDVFITEGGEWGADFDPDSVAEIQWGTGTFTSESCDQMRMILNPSAEFVVQGYTSVSYDLVRLTTSMLACP